MIRPVNAETDAGPIAAIYNHYIKNTAITFEETPVTSAQICSRITDVSADYPWFVCETDGVIAGYAYASKWKQRSAYRFTAETTVYLDHTRTGRGIGIDLYTALIDELTRRGMHVLIGCIAVPNTASERLHEKLGFKKAAHYHSVGFKFNKWIDVVDWELAL
ncbi:MAG: N-acetyltransferase family protein [Spirochaetes bacterium]|nr:N-acetyltransferase family protein [Spirochaetota bacterium]